MTFKSSLLLHFLKDPRKSIPPVGSMLQCQICAAVRQAGLSNMGGERAWLRALPCSLPARAKAAVGYSGAVSMHAAKRIRLPCGGAGHAQRSSSVVAGRESVVCGFVPKFYLLNAENAAGYANKNPEPACLSDVDPARKFVFIVHGILGTGRNWVPFTRMLVSKFPDWQFLLVDQRGHGESHFASRPRQCDGSAAAGDKLSELSMGR